MVDVFFCLLLFFKYSWPSVSTGFKSADSINHGLKIFGETKIPESSKKQKLNLPCTEHYAESTRMKESIGMRCCSLDEIQVICKYYTTCVGTRAPIPWIWESIGQRSVLEPIPCGYRGTTVISFVDSSIIKV